MNTVSRSAHWSCYGRELRDRFEAKINIRSHLSPEDAWEKKKPKIYIGRSGYIKVEPPYPFRKVISMPTCKDCKFYTSVTEKTGNCSNLGSEVFADRDAGMCPMRIFQPKN